MKSLYALALFVALLISSASAQTAPTIASISSSGRFNQGQSLSLSVSVNGTAPFTFQWKKAGMPIADATASTYGIAVLATSDVGSYTVTVTNGGGAITSDAILIDVVAATPPSFYYQPGNLVYTVGDTLNLYASVNGTSPLTFVWKHDGVVVPGATSSSYSKANAQPADGGSYIVTVSNVAGSVTSSAFTVTVNPIVAPVFSSNPSNRSVYTGDYLSLYSNVTRSNGTTFQWYRDGVAISGATYSSYDKSSVTTTDAGSYTVVATNSAGSTTSSAAVVTVTARVATAPSSLSITSGPLSVTIGESFNLYSSVYGTEPFTYQWRKDGVAISGATSSNYYRSNVTANDTGTYSLVVTNSVGSATSSDTMVSVSSAQVPIITQHPASMSIYPGNSASFSVNATGTGQLSFQWKKDGVAISGATSSYLYLSSDLPSGSSQYTVTVSNAQGAVTSQPATLTVLPAVAPVITAQPASKSASPGQSFELSVSYTGYPTPSFQWRKDGVAIAGATSSYFSISAAASSDSGSYSVVVSNSAGSVTSEAATVTISASTEPVLLAHPASASLLLGDSFSGLSVQVANQQGLTVQWYRDGAAITSATSFNYYISNAQPSHAGTYYAIVTNSFGAVTSQSAVISVDLSSARPVIVYVSGSQAVSGGYSVQPSINLAPGLASYTVIWKKDGVTVPNATALYLYLSNFALAMEGTYTAEVTVGNATYTSRPIVLELLNKGAVPRILTSPASTTRAVGDSASFAVQADGEWPLAFQWRKGGVDIPGAINSSYYTSGVSAATAGEYTVVVTNRNGTATSSVATLTVTSGAALGAPIFAREPISQTLTAGSSSFYLSVSVLNSAGTLTYQWYKDGVALSGATYSSYGSYETATASHAGRYKVTVTNAAGSATSGEAIVTVTARATGPVFTTQPSNQSGYAGSSVTFTAAVSSPTAVSYQWRKDGANLSGATGASLTLSNLQAGDAGTYVVVATNTDGSTASTPAQLTVTAAIAPTITNHPASQVSGRTGSVSFAVSATGTPAPGYQWKKNGADIPGANSATLSLTNLVTSQAGTYTVVVSNVGGSVTSNGATLVVYDELPALPGFSTQPQSRAYAPGESAGLSVVVTGFPIPALQWYKGGIAIAGATSPTLTLGKMVPTLAGDYYAVAVNELGTTRSTTATLTYAASPYAGTYFGTLSTGESWALKVEDDGTGQFLGMLSAEGKLIVFQQIVIGPTGGFTVGQSAAAQDRSAQSVGRYPDTGGATGTSTLPDRYFTGTLAGQITAGSVTGQLGGAGSLTGAVVATTTGATALAGTYAAVPLGASLGEIHALAGPDGSFLLVEVTVSGVRGGRGTLTGNSFVVTLPQISYTGVLASGGGAATGVLVGTYTPTGGLPIQFTAAPSTGNGLARLVNVSARGVAGKDSATLIAGFVISGNAPKDVLIRALGPTLSGLGVPGALVNPRLRLYQGGTAILDNDDWALGGTATEIAAATSRLGAYPLPAGSADAAMLAHLAPGVYSAHVTTNDTSTGVALLEVYDASEVSLGGPKVVNLSARGVVGRGADILIVGFVISGDAPKKVLIRGVGPALVGLGVTDALLDSKLRLHQGSAVVAENDNWSSGADAALVGTAASTVGAGSLAVGSKDAALLLYLAPGVYSAHVSGVGDTTGVALIEVYEVP